jgi:hypothetical protein
LVAGIISSAIRVVRATRARTMAMSFAEASRASLRSRCRAWAARREPGLAAWSWSAAVTIWRMRRSRSASDSVCAPGRISPTATSSRRQLIAQIASRRALRYTQLLHLVRVVGTFGGDPDPPQPRGGKRKREPQQRLDQAGGVQRHHGGGDTGQHPGPTKP